MYLVVNTIRYEDIEVPPGTMLKRIYMLEPDPDDWERDRASVDSPSAWCAADFVQPDRSVEYVEFYRRDLVAARERRTLRRIVERRHSGDLLECGHTARRAVHPKRRTTSRVCDDCATIVPK